MLVTQSYSGIQLKDTKVYIYYFRSHYEDNRCENDRALRAFIHTIERFSDSQGRKTAFFVPAGNNRFYGLDELEHNDPTGADSHYFIRDNDIDPHSDLPGILLSDVNLGHSDFYKNAKFLSISKLDPEQVLKCLIRIHDKITEINPKNPGILNRIFDSAVLKPSFMGLGIDLKTLFKR